MRRVLVLVPLVVVAALAGAPAAWAGGFVTVGLSSTPDGVEAGVPWRVDITILQHGRTPAPGLQPAVRIRSGDSVRTVVARPLDRDGVYRAEVTFPHAGRWDYEVLDGYSELPHTFAAVRIGAGTAAAADAGAPPRSAPAPAAADDGPATGWLVGAALALLAAVAVLLVDRRRRPLVPGQAT
jgi:hypothetical protein